MPDRLRQVIRSLMVFAVLAVASAPAFALVAHLDTFLLMKNGGQNTLDTFADGIPPPDGPRGVDTYTLIRGTMAESGGRLILDSSSAPPTYDVHGNLVYTTRATRNTNIDPTDTVNGLKIGHTFSVTATYDFINPAVMHAGDSYGVRFTDRSASGGLSGVANDVVGLNVSNQAIVFGKDNWITNKHTTLASLAFSAVPVGTDQIALTLTRGDLANNNIVASYSFLEGGTQIDSGTFTPTATIFNGENWTRAEFSVASAVPEPEIWAMMLAGCGLMGWMARRRREPALA